MSEPLPSLDVIVLCYNEEQEIGYCLEALLRQSGDLQRIIVVDNNSTDSSRAVIEQMQSQHPAKIHYVLELEQGVGPARNRGFAEAQADVMARIDADTRVLPGWAKAIRQFCQEHSEASAGTGAVEYYDLPGRRLARLLVWPLIRLVNKVAGGSANLYGANMFIRRDVWSAIKNSVRMDAGIMEDLAIGLALGEKDYRAAYVPAAAAEVSGRRMRTSPRQFMKYNMQWPRTYAVYGKPLQAAITRWAAWAGVAAQIPVAYLLQYHDGKTDKFSLKKVSDYEQRIIP